MGAFKSKSGYVANAWRILDFSHWYLDRDPACDVYTGIAGQFIPTAHTTINTIPDIVTIVASSYFQPIADLMESLLKTEPPEPVARGTTHRENGYAASITILLVAVLESYVSRLKFVRNQEIAASQSVPDLLAKLFPDLPNKNDLIEIFILRNIVVHNHVWHLDVSDADDDAKTIKSPIELGFSVNKQYQAAVDPGARRTRLLALNANPTAVDRYDVKRVFEVVWKTLLFMNSKDFSHTPLAGRTVAFRRQRISFEFLPTYIS